MKMAVPRKPRADDKERKKKRLKLKIPKPGEAPLGQQMPPGGAGVKETDEYDFSSDMGPAFGHPYAQPVVKRNFGVYASFFSLLRDFISESSESKVTTTKLEQQVLEWQNSPSSKLNVWVSMEKNWVELVSSALKFLSGDILGLTLEKFIPLVDFKERAQIWKWIGQGHDNDAYLTMLCTHWLEQRKQSILESGDANDEVPPARVKTDFVVRPTTDMEKVVFRAQELERFSSPHKAFTYKLHGYESTVGPVKGVYNKESPMNKAREHNLLVNERPAYVTILTLVRDSAARLPNGEGTRADICELLKDSQFLSPGVSDAQVNTVVSGALDRLHYEKDPCVKYDVNRKLWIYLHRSRSEEEFELIHQAHGAAAKAKRAMQKPKATKSRAKEPTTVTTIPPPQTQAAEDAAAVEALFQGQVPASQANSPRVVTLTPGMVRMTPPSPQTTQASQRGMETVFLQPGQRFAPQGMISQSQPGTPASSGTPTQSLYQIGGQRMTSSPRQTVVGNKPYSYSIVQSQGLPGQGSPQTAGKTVLVTQPHPGGSPQQQLQTSPRAVSASPTVGVTSQPSTPTSTPASSSPKPSPATSSGASSPLIARIVQQGPRGTQLMSVGNLLAAVQKQQSAPQGQGATTIKIQGTNIVHQVSGKPTHVISGGKPGGATAGGGKPITLTHVGGKPATLLQPGGKPATVLMSSMARNTTGGKPTQIVYSAGKPGQMGGKPLTMVTQIGGKPVAIATQSPEKQQPVTGQTRMVMGGKPVQIGGKPVYLTTSKQGFSGKPAAMTRLTTTSGSSILQTQRNQPVTPGSPRTGSPKVVMSPVQAGLILTQLAQGQGGKPAAQIKQTSSQSGGNSTQFIMQTGQGQTKVISPHQIVSQGGKPQNIQVLRTVLTQAGGKPGQTTFVITQAGLQQSQGGSTSQEGTQEETRGVTKTTTASVKVSKPGSAPVYARIITPPPGVRLTAVTQSQATPTQTASVIQTSGKIQTSTPPVTKPS
ncbi:nuclear factor related to kappa-B-binding protein-like [Lingula anatina]|uniref:Nuclear factor related to kappa-B-binding protein-like n=1 Tax=Lingula anatina TaxID=7574 RepID=A0A1S3JTD4_LINAN|nr:nuclear factor related to kappa-B-binding protein-like [Lingula anatina]|eukprot:XP_013413602.1 nuclear factor related to kappa-B-binding protein-like [Lingula anatina]